MPHATDLSLRRPSPLPLFSTVCNTVLVFMTIDKNVCCPIKHTMQPVSHPFAELLGGSAASEPHAIRRLWGLAVQSERALRATAPIWPAQRAAWGEEAADLLANIAKPASWLSDGILQDASFMPASASVPLARLLLSCAATELKAARVAGLQPGLWIFEDMGAADLESCSEAISPSVFSLLLPRLASTMPIESPFFANNAFMFVWSACVECDCDDWDDSLTFLSVLTSCHMSVLLSRSVADLGNPNQATRLQVHCAVMSLVAYAGIIAETSVHLSSQSVGGGLCLEDRAGLAHPILMLIHSPLLGLLASLQHVAVGTNAWADLLLSSEIAGMPPVHLLPAGLQPDAIDSKLAMQVGRSLMSSSSPGLLLLPRPWYHVPLLSMTPRS